MAFGQELQWERVQRSVSLESIAEGTKVPQRHLMALELEQFDQLPGGIFAKGILRSYCRHLGLNEEDWMQRFQSVTQQENSPEWAEFAETIRRNRVPEGRPVGIRWWGVLVMVMALAAASWVAWQYVVQPQVLGPNAGTAAPSQR